MFSYASIVLIRPIAMPWKELKLSISMKNKDKT